VTPKRQALPVLHGVKTHSTADPFYWHYELSLFSPGVAAGGHVLLGNRPMPDLDENRNVA
jgi:hypothetical protein